MPISGPCQTAPCGAPASSQRAPHTNASVNQTSADTCGLQTDAGSSCVLQYILDNNEVQVKTELWMKQNAEYLKEQKGEHQSINQPVTNTDNP